jgi:hypothetical protein
VGVGEGEMTAAFDTPVCTEPPTRRVRSRRRVQVAQRFRSAGSALLQKLPLPSSLRSRLGPEYNPLVVNPEVRGSGASERAVGACCGCALWALYGA